MKILLFDTETTGLPSSRKLAADGPNIWPHIVSMSWIVLDADTNKIEKKVYRIVKPESWTIPEDATRIHGITTEYATKNGVSLKSVMDEFRAEPRDMMIAHNMEFDHNVIVNAIKWDLKEPIVQDSVPRMCTMRTSRNICKIPSHYGYKSPKLSELYKFVFNKDPSSTSLHNSLYDTEILVEIVQHSRDIRSQFGLPLNGVYNPSNEHQTLSNKTLSIRFD